MYELTRTVLPALLLDQMLQFRRAVTRMLRAVRNDLLLTCLTPDIVTVGVRAFQVPRLLEDLFIEETGMGAPVCHCETRPWRTLILNDAAHRGHCTRMRKSVISISIHVSYCSSVMPMSSTSSRVTCTIETNHQPKIALDVTKHLTPDRLRVVSWLCRTRRAQNGEAARLDL
jgi:hypothetical protein